VVIISYWLLICIYILYFNGHTEDERSVHALDNSKFPGGATWFFLHFVLGFFILCFGIALKIISYYMENFDDPQACEALETTTHKAVFILLFLIVFVNYLIRMTHRAFKYKMWPSFWLRVPSCSLLLVIAFSYNGTHSHVCDLLIALATMILIIIVDFFALPYEDRIKMEHEHEEEEEESELDFLRYSRAHRITDRKPSVRLGDRAPGVKRTSFAASVDDKITLDVEAPSGIRWDCDQPTDEQDALPLTKNISEPTSKEDEVETSLKYSGKDKTFQDQLDFSNLEKFFHKSPLSEFDEILEERESKSKITEENYENKRSLHPHVELTGLYPTRSAKEFIFSPTGTSSSTKRSPIRPANLRRWKTHSGLQISVPSKENSRETPTILFNRRPTITSKLKTPLLDTTSREALHTKNRLTTYFIGKPRTKTKNRNNNNEVKSKTHYLTHGSCQPCPFPQISNLCF